MDYTITPATISEKEIIRDLLQPYLDELSRFPDENPDYKDENGIYLYPYLDNYWQEDSRFPYLFYLENKLAGFALVRKDGNHWEMAEYYVKPEFCRCGLGEVCATDIFKRHPGAWRIGFNKQNLASRKLWRKLAGLLSDGDIVEGESDISHDYLKFIV
jgi:predicted acetyltransferase